MEVNNMNHHVQLKLSNLAKETWKDQFEKTLNQLNLNDSIKISPDSHNVTNLHMVDPAILCAIIVGGTQIITTLITTLVKIYLEKRKEKKEEDKPIKSINVNFYGSKDTVKMSIIPPFKVIESNIKNKIEQVGSLQKIEFE